MLKCWSNTHICLFELGAYSTQKQLELLYKSTKKDPQGPIEPVSECSMDSALWHITTATKKPPASSGRSHFQVEHYWVLTNRINSKLGDCFGTFIGQLMCLTLLRAGATGRVRMPKRRRTSLLKDPSCTTNTDVSIRTDAKG